MSKNEDFKGLFDSIDSPVIHDPDGNKNLMEDAINIDNILEPHDKE